MAPDRIDARRAAIGPTLAVGLALALGLLVVLGLGGASVQASELRIANSGEPDTLDPHHVTGTWENRIIGDMFVGLTTEAADGSVISEPPRAGRSATTAGSTPSSCAITPGRTACR